jgi:serine/threonine protein kinase
VYRADWRGSLVAFKVTSTSPPTHLPFLSFLTVQVMRWTPIGPQVPTVEREVALLHLLRHPRVVILMGVCREMGPTEGSLGLIFELMESGSLYDLLHAVTEDGVSNRPSDLISKLTLCLDIADGMHFLHSSQVLHRDLKSANILLDRDGRCKIADFGLSTLTDSIAATQTAGLVAIATPAWTDPEVALGAKFSKASDMYSFGVVVWEIFSGEIPWDRLPVVSILTQVTVQRRRLEIRDTFPEAVKGLLGLCFGESLKRPDFACARELFQEMVRTQSDQIRRRGSGSVSIPSEERIKRIMEEMVSQFGTVVGQHVAPLHDSLKKIEDQLGGLRNVFRDLRTELLSLNNGEGWSRLAAFWTMRMERLESLVGSSGCNEGMIVREMKILGSSLNTQLLELDMKGDLDAMVRELNKVRDEIVQANTEHNEEMMNELLEELKRMISD